MYFSQFLQAICQLGFAGLGKDHSRYDIVSIGNTRGKELLDGQDILMGRYEVQTVKDYVRYRLGQKSPWEKRIRFKTPVTLKYQGKFQEELILEAIIPAILRRIYILDCFEGLDCQELRWEKDFPEAVGQNCRMITVYRYSSTQDRKVALRGVKGDMELSELPQELLPVLLAGEILHIGKNTSFGFGRYRVS